MRAVILSGAGPTADPWHPFAETSEALAGIVETAGYETRVVEGPIEGLATLTGDERLIVVNAGDPDGPQPDGIDAPPPEPALVAGAAQALDDALERGVGILAVHSAASTLRELPAFGEALGARWIPGRSWHPPIGEAHVHIVGDHTIADGLTDFTLVDERYSGMPLTGVIEPIAEHVEDGIRHPLVWARELGPSRLVYSALGHDARAYESTEYRELLARSLDWLSRVPAATFA